MAAIQPERERERETELLLLQIGRIDKNAFLCGGK